MYTVEFNAKHPWIQDRLEESGNYSYQGWGEFTLTATQSTNLSSTLRCDLFAKTLFFQSRFSLLIINFLNLTLSELTSTLTYMQANTNAHKTHAHTHRQTYTHTLPDLAYKKMCVCEQRKFVGGADTHTHPAGPVLGAKAVTCTT